MDVRSTSRRPAPRVRHLGGGHAPRRQPRAPARGRDAPRDCVQRAVLRELPDGRAPQSWGRGRDASREEDHAARRAFIAAASRAQGVPIETRLAEILHPNSPRRWRRRRRGRRRKKRRRPRLPPERDAGHRQRRRRRRGPQAAAGGAPRDRLVAGLAAAIVGPDPERAMLAAYSWESSPGPCRAASWRSAARRAPSAPSAARRTAPPSRKTKTKTRWTRRAAAALPFLEARGAASAAPFGGTETLDTLDTLDTLETHPLVAARRVRAEAVAASARGRAAAAARAVLADGGAPPGLDRARRRDAVGRKRRREPRDVQLRTGPPRAGAVTCVTVRGEAKVAA